MIAEGEVRRLASHGQVDPMILNLDYSLSWLLAALFSTEGITEELRFKGDTCLRKCYFPGYRRCLFYVDGLTGAAVPPQPHFDDVTHNLPLYVDDQPKSARRR